MVRFSLSAGAGRRAARTASVVRVIEARRTSILRSRYHIVVDGAQVATWEGSTWRTGGIVELAGRRHQVRANLWGTTFEMVDDAGTLLASARRVGRKDWTVEAGATTYQFRRASFWRQEQELLAGGQRVGFVRRTGIWRGDVVADLPGLPLAVEVFALAVVLATWDSESAAAAAG